MESAGAKTDKRHTMCCCCAACGKNGDGLKRCNACKSVSYCNTECQRSHWKTHRDDCQKREEEIQAAVEGPFAATTAGGGLENLGLADSKQSPSADLFDPPPPKADCLICMLPLPSNGNENVSYQACCGNTVCMGCILESHRILGKTNVERRNKKLPFLCFCCPFCRTPKSGYAVERGVHMLRKRMELNDANAFSNMARNYCFGRSGVTKDWQKYFELTHRAAELGSLDASYHLAREYAGGKIVPKDQAKRRYYLEAAAKGGHNDARCELGSMEADAGNHQLAVKHWQISASAGHKDSLYNVGLGHRRVLVTHDEYAATLRAYQKFRGEETSEQRDKYDVFAAAFRDGSTTGMIDWICKTELHGALRAG